jgi:hypothetical protein
VTDFDKYRPECPQVVSITNREISIRESASVGISNRCQLGRIKAGSGSTVENNLPIELSSKLIPEHH